MNRPDTDAQDQLSKSSFSACNARPVHTEGPDAEELRRSKTARRILRHVCFVPKLDIAHAIDFRVCLATSIKARSFGAKEARRG
jgi:hypothetical protein